jgi:predicted signal transduction protein with EAL and GGDEF domain
MQNAAVQNMQLTFRSHQQSSGSVEAIEHGIELTKFKKQIKHLEQIMTITKQATHERRIKHESQTKISQVPTDSVKSSNRRKQIAKKMTLEVKTPNKNSSRHSAGRGSFRSFKNVSPDLQHVMGSHENFN